MFRVSRPSWISGGIRDGAASRKPAALSLIDRRMQRVVEPGRFDVMVGTSSVQLTTASLEVTAR
jgi:hypothetical protein